MNDETRFAGYGAYLYGAMTILGLVLASLAFGERFALLSAIAASGLSYLAQYAAAFEASGYSWAARAFMALSFAAVACVVVSFVLLIG